MKIEKSKINPKGFNVLAEVTVFEKIKDNIYVGPDALASKTSIEFYYGKAIKLGDSADSVEHCPELKEGDNIIFSQFAGYAATTVDGYCKIIRGHDIVAIVEGNFEDMTENTLKPTEERILVKIIGEDLIDENGIYDDTEDPRDAVTQKGVVIRCAENATQYAPGTIVSFDPFCGNLIVNEPNLKLKTINSLDVLYTIEK